MAFGCATRCSWQSIMANNLLKNELLRKRVLLRKQHCISAPRETIADRGRCWLIVSAAVGGVTVMMKQPCRKVSQCKSESSPQSANDDGDDDFDFEFAKPPVTSVDMSWGFSARVSPGIDGSRPTVDVKASSSFSLPVERGWPRDVLSPEKVASNMRDALADRLPRFVADFWDMELSGSPAMLRGLRGGWPQASNGDPPAVLRWRFLPPPFSPLLTVSQMPDEDGSVLFRLGGFLCGGVTTSTVRVECKVIGLAPDPSAAEGEERLDLRLVTELSEFPVAGRAWVLVGCGGSWWHDRIRLPVIREVFRGFHEMVHEQMMLHYVAALGGDAPVVQNDDACTLAKTG
eukprot:TRINITY_DN40026_c0_g1_i1.p1 TRINITY_DN40026_c0_g1~~TRINITY_DN40026_c0_g1_i1.p1  ORF type:complete len:345 (-),score=52.54 TRINITY_DN40026_c0_g1_i1:8-1042(-)